MRTLETECETDGRWIAEIVQLPGVLAYGDSREEAVAKAEALALRVLADRLEHGNELPQVTSCLPEKPSPTRSAARA